MSIFNLFLVWIPQASAPITSGMRTDGVFKLSSVQFNQGFSSVPVHSHLFIKVTGFYKTAMP